MPESYTFQNLFVEQLNDLFNAEQQIADALPRFIVATQSTELHDTLVNYQHEVDHHIVYLRNIFNDLKLMPTREKCEAVAGMIEEGELMMRHGGVSAVKDAALIAIVQRLQHYKMALYGTARTFARHLQSQKVVDLHNLQRALNEESEADKKLTKLAEGGMFTTGINEEAMRHMGKI